MTYQKVVKKAVVPIGCVKFLHSYHAWKNTCIELSAFAVYSISSNKEPNKPNFEISQVDDTFTLYHQSTLT